MRYYQIVPTRHDMFLRWTHFDRRRPWLDLANPDCILTLQLIGEDAGQAELRFEDRDGAPVPHEVLPDPQVPQGLPDFAQAPAAKRQLLRIKVRFPGPAPLYLRRVSDGLLLLTLVPVIAYPGFLFALMRECQASFCPEGFANFVETGTLMAHTTLHASYWFDKVWTIELSQDLHRQAEIALKDRRNVICLQGNSGDLLPGLAASLSGPSFFFLDAHWSGDDSVDWDTSRFSGYPVTTARIATPDPTGPGLTESDRQVPLMTELTALADLHRGKAVVLIDDWGSIGRTDFGFAGEDWTALDAARIRDWIAAHPRTQFHFRADHHRYLWAIGRQDGNPESPPESPPE